VKIQKEARSRDVSALLSLFRVATWPSSVLCQRAAGLLAITGWSRRCMNATALSIMLEAVDVNFLYRVVRLWHVHGIPSV